MELIARSSGAIDLQINGALGLSFNEITAHNHHLIPEICQLLWKMGIDAFLPTLITTSLANYQRSFAYLAKYVGQRFANSAQIIGIHLEGPFLHPDKRGAHPLAYLLPLNQDSIHQLLGDYGTIVKLITLAPELDMQDSAISYLRRLGILVSLGHSTADQATTLGAIAQGANMVTHAYNAMPSLHHRSANLLTEALLNDQLYCGAIADGVHVHPKMMELLCRLKKERLFLVSDALAPFGLAEGIYSWDHRQIEVKAGTARLEDGTLAGTTLPLWLQAENLVRWGICPMEEAIATVTSTPAQLLGLSLSPSLAWYRSEDGRYIYQRTGL